MFSQPLADARRTISALRTSMHFNRALRDALATDKAKLLPPGFATHPPHDEWKKLDHSVVVSRLYLIYESLIHECVSEWLETLASLVEYNKLPESVRSAHRDGIGYILQNIEGRRFSYVSPATLVKEYNEALSGLREYKLHADAFLLHDRNLRTNELQEVLTRCGISLKIVEWLKNHSSVAGHDSLQLLGHATIEKAISALVDLRNEASHATRQIVDILGEETLIAYIDLIDDLADSIAEAFTHSALDWHVEHGAWNLAGKINFVHTSNRQICVAPLTSCHIKIGSTIYLKGKYHCRFAKVQEIRLNDVAISDLTLATEASEVGLRLDIEAFKGSEVFVQTMIATEPITNSNQAEVKEINIIDPPIGDIDDEDESESEEKTDDLGE